MNRTHVESAVKSLVEEAGYTLFSGAPNIASQLIKTYPAAWLAPLEMVEIDGRHHGTVRYRTRLSLMRSAAKLSPDARRAAWDEMERQAIDIFAALSNAPKILTVEKLTVTPSVFALTNHGEIAQTADAQIITFF